MNDELSFRKASHGGTGKIKVYTLCPPCSPCLRVRAFYIVVLVVMFAVSSCSTRPKNPGNVYDLRRQAETQLALGSRQADRGSFDLSLILLDEAMRLGVATDDSSLRIRAGLSRGNVLFSTGYSGEAEEAWNEALSEAERIGNNELAAISRIHIARGKLLSPSDKSATDFSTQAIRDDVERNLAQIRSDQYYIAFAWTILGLAEKELGQYAQAEEAVRRGLEIHVKGRYYELAAYDWFMIASFRSLSGDYRRALEALETAIDYDRRVENSWGLASDWRAMGDVHRKAGNAEASLAAYQRAAGIFRALGNDEAAAETLSRAENR